MALSVATLLFTLLFTAVAVVEALRMSRDLRRLQESLQHLARRRAEQTFAVERGAQLVQTQVLAEGAVRGTTSAVRTIHKNIANIPFGILESIPVTRSTARFVRNIHDRTADGVYDTISSVNRLVGGVARSGLASRTRAMSVPQAAAERESGSMVALPTPQTPSRALGDGRRKK